ncbi:MAG TPA: hypothetical protein VHN14_23875 [Kofleriaceae bacterium]|jgi:hypothetical protein|nr:hypothetical protein [Kofleriaceae bacterium]
MESMKDRARPEPSTRANRSPTSVRTIAPTVAEASSGRLAALEGEVARLRADRTEHASTPSDEPDPQAERARVEAQFSEFERRLLADPVDPSWSGVATESLRSDLSAAAREGEFSLVAVECRTELCRATLQWDSYEAARRTGMHLAERAIPGLNCTKSIWLKEPDHPDAPYSSNLFLDCSEQRAGTTDTIPVTDTIPATAISSGGKS